MSYRHWDDMLSEDANRAVIREISTLFSHRIMNKDWRNKLLWDIFHDNYESLLKHEIADYASLSVTDAISIRQVLAFFQKRADLDVGIDRRDVALRKWEAAELACRETNARLRSHGFRGYTAFSFGVDSIIHAASRKISRVLGPVPALSDLVLKFGPGSTTSIPKRNASYRAKLGNALQCSANFVPLLQETLEEMGSLFEPHFRSSDTYLATVDIVNSKLGFVPKNAKTDRTIGVEPSLNMFVQLGIGKYMEDRLRRVGVDIRDQTLNQRLAREGSITGALATLDLSSASDTVSRELVAHLLPFDWYLLLDSARSYSVEIKLHDTENLCAEVPLEKFSSMGNGFTFPLETLIFWALTSSAVDSVCDGHPELETRVSVYGDDIICPTHCSALVTQCLEECGFEVNTSKSYASGNFRESCGKDYFFGIDVRPVYLKDKLGFADLFRLYNFFYRNHDSEVCDLLLTYIPMNLRIYGPDGYGDGHLLSKAPLTPYKRSVGWSGYTFETFTRKSRKSFRPSPGDYVYPFYSVYARLSVESEHEYRGERLGVTLPGFKGYKRIRIYTLSPS